MPARGIRRYSRQRKSEENNDAHPQQRQRADRLGRTRQSQPQPRRDPFQHNRDRRRRDRADRGEARTTSSAASTSPRSTSSTASSPSPASPMTAGTRSPRRWRRRSSTMRATSSARSRTRPRICRPGSSRSTATSPDDITVTWIGANEYFRGENTQYGRHQMILEGGVDPARHLHQSRARRRRSRPHAFAGREPVSTSASSGRIPTTTS